tara:strand:- start:191 stop:652 length:462 start_codon:yes stop_codon:yes gene_type:complete
MASTTFSGPIKAGTIRHTTGTTVGDDVKNIGHVVMSQSAEVKNTDTTDLSTNIVLPAKSHIIAIDVNVEVAFNGGGADTLDVGIVGNSDLYVDNADVSAIGPVALGATGLCANWKNIGTSDVRVAMKYIDASGNSSAGKARVTITYTQANNHS